MLSPLAAAALLLAVTQAAAAEHWVPLEQGVPVHQPSTSSWVKGSKPPPEHNVTLTVVLRLEDEPRAELERTFFAVSDPKNERYGQHLSLRQLARLLAVPSKRVERVRSYFLTAGASEAEVAPSRDMISVTMPVAAAEAALKTTLHVFSHSGRKHVHILRASSGYALPASIAADVTMVGELMQFPRLRRTSLEVPVGAAKGKGLWKNACTSSSCSGLVTPAVLAERYKLPTSNSSVSKGSNSMAVAEFQGQYFKPSDIATFAKSCHRDVTVDKVVGGNRPSSGVEAELDIEYIKAVAQEIPLTVVYNSAYSLLGWAKEITSMEEPVLVHSVSYGNDEAQQTGEEYMLSCNTAFMKAGVQGISILFASGDQGVCGREGCSSGTRFHPDFPGGSPYITAVGGTDFKGSDIGPETAWSASGGGFSDTFGIPKYQKDAVEAYKSSPDADLPPRSYWNATGRGYPDVAALGGTKTPYCVVSNGVFSGVAGTSASSPVVAGVFAKINGLRLSSGKAPLGFLNPFIYQSAAGFQDVTSGTNSAGGDYGFTAIKGWDAATGLGTPDYEALSKLAMSAVGVNDNVIVV